MATIGDWLETAIGIYQQSENVSGKSEITDLATANAIALGIEQVIGVRPVVIQDTTGSVPVYTLHFTDTTEATNAIVKTFERWRGKLSSSQASNVKYDFGPVLVPAIVKEFFLPIAATITGIAFIGYKIGKGSH